MKKIILALLLLLIPTILFAEQIGIKIGNFKFNETGYGYTNNFCFGVDLSSDFNKGIQYRLSADYYRQSFDTNNYLYSTYLYSITPSLKFNFTDYYISPYVGVGIGLFLVKEIIKYQTYNITARYDSYYHGLGEVFYGGVDFNLNEDISMFIELEWDYIEISGIDFGGRKVYLGTRFKY